MLIRFLLFLMNTAISVPFYRRELFYYSIERIQEMLLDFMKRYLTDDSVTYITEQSITPLYKILVLHPSTE